MGVCDVRRLISLRLHLTVRGYPSLGTGMGVVVED